MVWYISDFGTTSYTLTASAKITKNSKGLDFADVECAGTFTEDTAVKILNGTTEIFRGYVKVSKEKHQGQFYALTVYETAIELRDYICSKSGSNSFIESSQTATALINLILTGTGWTTTVVDATVIPSMSFYYINASDAVFKVIEDLLGKKVWFDNVNKKVYWGTYNTDRTGSGNISYTTKLTTNDSVGRNINKVIVIGKDDSIQGDATTGSSTPLKVYNYSDGKTNDECDSIATQILAEIQNPSHRYDVTIMPPVYTYDICDQIKVDSVDYVIFDIVTTQKSTVLGIGDYKKSIFDILGGRLTEVTGQLTTGADASWSGGNANVAANAASYTTYIWDIKDINQVAGSKIDATISGYDKGVSVSATTNYLSEISQTVNDGSSTDVASFTSTIYLPDSTNGLSLSTMANGYQFGHSAMIGQFSAQSARWLTAQLEYRYGTSGAWTSTGNACYYYIGTAWETLALSSLYSGNATSETGNTLYIRWKITVSGNNLKGANMCMQTERVPRHIHTVNDTSTYDKTTTGTPPSTVSVHINSGSDQTLTPGTPLTISGSIGTLVTGKNTIYIKTPASAGNQCSVNPTITYQTLGRS